MDYQLLKTLVDYLEQFHQRNASSTIEDFAKWLNYKLLTTTAEAQHTPQHNHDDLIIGFKLMHVNKDLKKATKSILATSPLSSLDEYSFLLHLNYQDSFRKMELVELHNLEAPTGIEIIKRLIKNTLVEEFPDTQDRRAKRIKITSTGMQVLEVIKPQIDLVFSKLVDPLSHNERIQINNILDKLMD